jgi:hypothetical protein
LWQELSVAPDLSVAENVFLGAQPTNRFGLVQWRRMAREAGEQLARFGIDVDPMSRLGDLPIGLQQLTEYSGLNVKLILGSVMVIAAVCAGIGGMLGVAHFGSAQQNEFDTYLLDSIAAVVVGGTSLFGGRGGIGNTIVGLFVLGVLNNGLDHVNIDSFLKILIRGLILLAALVINVYAQRLRAKAAE